MSSVYYINLINLEKSCIVNIDLIENEKINNKITIMIMKYVAPATGNCKSL